MILPVLVIAPVYEHVVRLLSTIKEGTDVGDWLTMHSTGVHSQLEQGGASHTIRNVHATDEALICFCSIQAQT